MGWLVNFPSGESEISERTEKELLQNLNRVNLVGSFFPSAFSMFHPNSDLPESELLKTLLEPLLEDFQYWFDRSRSLLENHQIEFLGQAAQADLLHRVQQAQKEVIAAQTLMKLTEGKVGVEATTLMPWHNLVTECWRVGMRFRMENS